MRKYDPYIFMALSYAALQEAVNRRLNMFMFVCFYVFCFLLTNNQPPKKKQNFFLIQHYHHNYEC